MVTDVRDFLRPDLGEGLEDAEIVTRRVAEGDPVELNQILVEVNTAKALVEIPAPWEGVVEKRHAAEGDVVNVGAPLVSIRVEIAPETEGETREGKPKRQAVLVGYGVEEEAPRSARPTAGPRAPRARRGPVAASPPVRRLAKELGVDLAAVEGTGQSGRVTREDVQRAAEGTGAEVAPAAPAETIGSAEHVPAEQRIPVRGTRRLIAEKMARSAAEIPHVTTFLTVDATWLQAFRADLEKESGQRVTPLAIVVRALAEVIGKHPKLNSSFAADGSEIVLHGECHVGIATDTEDGLLVPVVRDANRRGILDIAAEIARLVEAARSRTAKLEDVTGSTITITNVGTFGAEYGTPIINYPEAAILALGVIEPRALVVGGKVEARPAVTLSMSFDHRVMDGAEAGRALKDLAVLLETPFRLGALPR
jgi:2-oxoisovalerate dehydrogenase E2 component (dihydrolipoyl transacylase)